MVNVSESLSVMYEGLREIAQHGLDLARKLQEFAPSDNAVSPSAQYLYYSSIMIQESSNKVRRMMLERDQRIQNKEM